MFIDAKYLDAYSLAAESTGGSVTMKSVLRANVGLAISNPWFSTWYAQSPKV